MKKRSKRETGQPRLLFFQDFGLSRYRILVLGGKKGGGEDLGLVRLAAFRSLRAVSLVAPIQPRARDSSY